MTANNDGELTEVLEKMWEDNELELKQKIDSYGHVLDELNAELNKLKQLKQDKVARINNAIDRVEAEIEKIKSRLHYHCNEQPLRGNEYSFHPYVSSTTDHIEEDKVEKSYFRYSLPHLTHEEYMLLEAYDCAEDDLTAS